MIKEKLIKGLNIGSADNIIKLLNTTYFGTWQRDIISHIFKCPKSIVQAPRQVGKTYAIALVATCYIVGGGSVIVGMPTMTQSKENLFDAIVQNVTKLSQYSDLKDMLSTSTRDKAGTKTYTNGAEIRAISLNTTSQKEGWTADLLIIDEAHGATQEILGVCQPFLFQASRRGEARIVLNGIGGHVRSLIEEMKAPTTGYESLLVRAADVVAEDPTYGDVFQDYKASVTPIEYDQNILCLPISEGSQLLFPHIPLLTREQNDEVIHKMGTIGGGTYYFGIDVGEKHDSTVVTVIRHWGDYFDLVDVFTTKGSFIDEGGGQERDIAAFIKTYPHRGHNITIETNFNSMLFQSLQLHHFFDMNGLQLTYKSKKGLSDTLINMVKHNQFRVLNELHVKDLESLQFSIDVKGNWTWTHSDLLSSLLMAMASQMEAILF